MSPLPCSLPDRAPPGAVHLGRILPCREDSVAFAGVAAGLV